MSGIKDQDRIEALRKRLYERGKPTVQPQNHDLSEAKKNIHTTWETPPIPKETIPEPEPEPSQLFEADSLDTPTMAPKKQKRGYRLKVVLAGILFFVLAVGISSGFLIFGNRSISAENITIVVTGPFTVGGGEVLPLQVGITNANTVAIEAATLIVEYPRGTLSATDQRVELRTEHLALDQVASGETINIPLRALVFGEENDEKIIEVSIEYRVQGSNATFFKEADPLRFKINSSPVTMRVTGLRKVSSGQETEVEIEITSNAPTDLPEVLVRADYPIGFEFVSSSPSPVSAQNVWLIEDLEPEQSRTILVKGIVVGKETDEHAINFTAGVSNERDRQTLASVFATAQTEFEIEQPFLNIEMEIDGKTDNVIVIDPGQNTSASIEIENTLDDTLYDIVVEVQLGGNALSDLDVGPPNGFYDSLNNKIIWDVSNAPELAELFPGKKTRLSFGLEPSEKILRTPQITLDVSVKARRVSETSVAETLLGTTKSLIKVASAPKIRTDAGFNNGVFSDKGPVPPAAEQKTDYTISFMIENGSNDIANAVTTATLPSYVTWLEQTSGAGDVTYDPSRRTVTWLVGAVDANAAAFGSFQVSLSPSKSQIGSTPTLLEDQRMKADDLFTGIVVRSENAAITTEMSTEAGHLKGNGRVIE